MDPPLNQINSKRQVMPETIVTGPVKLRIYQAYLHAAKSPLLLLFIVSSFFLSNIAQILQQYIVKVWTSDINYAHRTLHVYLVGIAVAAGGVAFFSWLRTYLATIFGMRSSRALHNDMALSMLSAPLSFFGRSFMDVFYNS